MADCVCGSGLASTDCCMPKVSPVTVLPTTEITLSGEFTVAGVMDNHGQLHPISRSQARQITEHLSMSTSLFYPDQTDSAIDALLERIVARMSPGPLDYQQEKCVRDFGSLRIALNATRYHQRQFFYRWNRLRARYSLRATAMRTNRLEVRFDDLPLRFEFQAFVSALDTVIDVTWRLVVVRFGRSPRRRQDFRASVERESAKYPTLNPIVRQHKSWVLELAKLRNAVAHEGSLEAFQGFGYRGQDVLHPSLRPAQGPDTSAPHLAIQLWKDGCRIVEDTLVAALREEP